MVGGKLLKEIKVGEERTFCRTVTEADIVNFAGVSGDFNPLHVDAEHAKRGIFGERVAHGIFTLSLVSTTLAKLPGDVVYISQSAKFVKPVKIGDTIRAVSRVEEKKEKGILRLATNCYNQMGEIIMEGEAQVRIFEPEEQ